MAAIIASLSALSQTQEKEAELSKFAAAYPEIILGEEIDKLHFQDKEVIQTMKELVA